MILLALPPFSLNSLYVRTSTPMGIFPHNQDEGAFLMQGAKLFHFNTGIVVRSLGLLVIALWIRQLLGVKNTMVPVGVVSAYS
jgi:hypothetical protein